MPLVDADKLTRANRRLPRARREMNACRVIYLGQRERLRHANRSGNATQRGAAMRDLNYWRHQLQQRVLEVQDLLEVRRQFREKESLLRERMTRFGIGMEHLY